MCRKTVHCLQVTLKNNGVCVYAEDMKIKKKELLDKERNVDFETIFNFFRLYIDQMFVKKQVINWEMIQTSLQQKVDKKFTSITMLKENLKTLIETEYPNIRFETNKPLWNSEFKKL
jgi:hypothetical protein